MEITDLMIRDWISSPYGNIQIEFLYNNGYDDVVGEHKETYIDWDTGEEDIRTVDITIDMVDPISLTEEIILSNGFTSYGDGVVGIPAIGLVLTWDTDRWFANYGNIQIRYVHELQHLLRLVGLSDFANDFKID